MYITKESDYAVRIVSFLAKEDRRVDANTIANNTGVSLRFSLKILRSLVSSSIAKSFKGTQGGYELNRPATEITLREILQAIEGEYVFSRCLYGTNDCSNPINASGCGACNANKVYNGISVTVREMLSEVKVADLIT